jgi:Glycosyl hydrolases family 31
MRTQANGIAVPAKPRPQVWDADQIDNWRRYAKLRTQLYPYLVAADRDYRRTGLPLMRHLALAYPGDERAVASDDEFLFGPDLLAAPVLEPGATERSLYLPRGRWIHLWDALAYRERDGGLRMRTAKLLRGGRDATLPAPLDELPLLARAGAILPLLTPGVDTLAGDYEYSESTSLAERSRKLVLLAFPRGTSKARFLADERVVSRQRPGRWTLRVAGDMRRTYQLQASLATLRVATGAPCRVRVDGERVPRRRWEFHRATEVLRLTLRGRTPRLVVEWRC